MKIKKKNFSRNLPLKKKILLINEINQYNFIIFIFLRIFFDKIFYLKIHKYFRYKKLILFLSAFKIDWLNYNDYNIQDVHAKRMQKSVLFCDKYSSYIAKNIWCNSLKKFFLNKDLLTDCINSKIYIEIRDIFELMEIANILKKNNKVLLFISNNFFFKTINEKYLLKNLNFVNLDIFKILNIIISMFLKIFNIVIKKFISIFLSKKIKSKQNNKKFKEKMYKVAFFPHKGIINREGIKNYFYINKIKSNFNKKNIAHIEWDLADLNKKNINYYSNNNIPLFFWNSYSYQKSSLIHVYKFLISNLHLIYKIFKFSILIELLKSIYQINNALEKIRTNFSQLEYILIGYDILFANEISIACKHLNIKTVSFQNRILIPSWAPKMSFDYYFILGPSSKKILKKRMGKSIKYFYPIRITSKINANFKKHKDIKKLKCLVIDYHSFDKKKWYENGIANHNWKINLDFYNKILTLSKKYPNILFLIKSKNYVWLKHHYFRDLVKILNKQKNIKILKDQKKWTPEYSVKITDFAIAKYSSLSDQMLYQNKPVLILNDDGFPGLLYNFGEKIFTNNFNQLENKVYKIQKNYHKFNKSLKQIRKKLFFYDIKGNTLKNLLINIDDQLNVS